MDKVKEEKKCEFYDDYECNAYYNIYPEPEDCQRDLCRTHKDCYYRQLKRKEQECEKLKWLIETKCESELDKENSELKAENKRLKLSERDLSRICQGFKNDIETEKSYTLKYYKTLQEIKDIVSEPCIVDENCQTCNSGCMQKDILTKINEVIGAE